VGNLTCERCGFTAEGLFAEAVYARHVEDCKAREAFVAWQRRITDEDRVFLKVQRIVWDE
jgi:hypothetical protein